MGFLSFLFQQRGGGSCSLCGASGVTKVTCPFNPAAKNPKPEKHNKKQLQGVVSNNGGKATGPAKSYPRKSPAQHASQTPIGTKMVGQDGKMYIIKLRKNGSHYWQPCAQKTANC